MLFYPRPRHVILSKAPTCYFIQGPDMTDSNAGLRDSIVQTVKTKGVSIKLERIKYEPADLTAQPPHRPKQAKTISDTTNLGRPVTPNFVRFGEVILIPDTPPTPPRRTPPPPPPRRTPPAPPRQNPSPLPAARLVFAGMSENSGSGSTKLTRREEAISLGMSPTKGGRFRFASRCDGCGVKFQSLYTFHHHKESLVLKNSRSGATLISLCLLQLLFVPPGRNMSHY